MATDKDTKTGEAGATRTGAPTPGPDETIEKAAEAGRAYVEATSAAAISGLKTAFDLQGDAIVAGRSVADATIEASKQLTEQWAEAVREGQAATTKLAETSAKLAVKAFETK